ncbi:hypothetical protein HZH66_005011 [Vespula vulgaris]|uniref:Uncharacterized protein n=1 Tax=Vespula vulgaris TaxID=7454 RepID=A0A834K947_VESVU|nr:hypothetical protein HZH66_005011 [Vespula vulgaris]
MLPMTSDKMTVITVQSNDIRRNNTGHLTDDNDVPEGQGRVILAHSKTTHSHLGQDPNVLIGVFHEGTEDNPTMIIYEFHPPNERLKGGRIAE